MGWQPLVVALLLGAAISWRYRQQPISVATYGAGWAVALALAVAVHLAGGSVLAWSVANVSFALGWVLVAARPAAARALSPLSQNQDLPLLYAGLGLLLRAASFTPYTGGITLGASLVALVVGQRQARKPITYLALAGLSLGGYELAAYRLLQAEPVGFANSVIGLAWVALAIAAAYRMLAWWLHRSETAFALSATELGRVAHLHWGNAAAFMVATILIDGLGEAQPVLPTVMGWGALGGYALLQGRTSAAMAAPVGLQGWVYLGITALYAAFASARQGWWLLELDPAWVAIACAFGLVLALPRWSRWGWPDAAWHRAAALLPLPTALLSCLAVAPLIPILVVCALDFDLRNSLNMGVMFFGKRASAAQIGISLVVAAAFYGWLAWRWTAIRWSYLGVGALVWASGLWLHRWDALDPLAQILLVGLPLLYLAQAEPELRRPQQRSLRHGLRLLGSGAITGVAYWQYAAVGLVPGAIGLVLIAAGLGLRVRAFLWVGTLTVLGVAFDQAIVLFFRYAFAKWIVGLLVGLLSIGLAANFERRRQQASSVVRRWRAWFRHW
ncbi:MAG: hypothetical protein BRC58_01190 [Cyanobacteria bacterium QS_8_64_29]|nr:MAG: hypothetical protein BRC58_01190 [Cyanobacteria bacterium QS_8_64_29]